MGPFTNLVLPIFAQVARPDGSFFRGIAAVARFCVPSNRTRYYTPCN
jgi:hypothetical protein